MKKDKEVKQEEIGKQTPSEILGGLLVWLRENRNLAVWSSVGNCHQPKIVLTKQDVQTGVLFDGKFKTNEKQKKYTFSVCANESEVEFLNSHKAIIEDGLYEVSSLDLNFEPTVSSFTKEEEKINKMRELLGDRLKIIK